MKRRSFVKNAGLASALVGAGTVTFGKNPSLSRPSDVFGINFAPHLGMFKHSAGEDPLDQLRFMANAGFRAFEDNDMRNRPLAVQESMARVMAEHDIKMGVFVAHTIAWSEPNLASGKLEWREQFLSEIKAAIPVAKRVNATWMTVVPGYLDLRLNMGYQTANVVESLKQAAALLEPHGLVMVLEPLNFRNHPGMFLSGSAQAYEICKAVNSPSCKILFDIYHQQIQEGNLIPNIEACWDEIAYFQIGDNPGRNEPTTGEINYANVFEFISKKGYTGILGMEHGNSVAGISGEEKVIDAYRSVDPKN